MMLLWFNKLLIKLRNVFGGCEFVVRFYCFTQRASFLPYNLTLADTNGTDKMIQSPVSQCDATQQLKTVPPPKLPHT